jgi:hypothetical protein
MIVQAECCCRPGIGMRHLWGDFAHLAARMAILITPDAVRNGEPNIPSRYPLWGRNTRIKGAMFLYGSQVVDPLRE